MVAPFGGRITAGWSAVLFAAALMLALAGRSNPQHRVFDLPFLSPFASGTWIVFPTVPRTSSHRVAALETRFRRRFSLARVPKRVEARIHTLGVGRIYINGRNIESEPRTPASPVATVSARRLEISGELRAGHNELLVEVQRSDGPAALSVLLRGDGFRLSSDASWEASLAGSSWRAAREASQRSGVDPHVIDARARSSLLAARHRLRSLVGFGAISVFVVAGGMFLRRRQPRLVSEHGCWLGIATAFAIGVAWLALSINNAGQIDRDTGFDAADHWAYITYIMERGELPLADSGFQMYQPPLYYLMCAGLLKTLGLSALDPAANVVLRMLSMLLGLGHILLLFGCIRLLFPRDPGLGAAGLLFVGALPVHLYVFHFVGNEGLAATLSSATAFLCLRILGRERSPLTAYLVLGVALGFALLAKFSTAILLPAVAGALALHALSASERTHSGESGDSRRIRDLGAAAVALVCALLVASVHYARVYWRFGRVLVANWETDVGFDLWQDPGYRVVGDYLSFGPSLTAPWYAGLLSVPDGLYSTLFGDGLASGSTIVSGGAPWSHDLMCAGYLLAPIPLLVMLVGGVRSVVIALRERRIQWLFVVGVGLLMCGAVVVVTLRVPYYSMTKAFYGLPAGVCGAAFFASGLAGMRRRPAALRAVVFCSLVTWAVVSYAAVWIRPSSPANLVRQGMARFEEHDYHAAVSLHRQALSLDPDLARARVELCRALYAAGSPREAGKECDAVLEGDSGHVEAILVKAAYWLSVRRLPRAEFLLERARALHPWDERSYLRLVPIALARGQSEKIVSLVRDHLALNPWLTGERVHLVEHLIRLGDYDAAERQLRYLLELAPDEPGAEALRERLARAAGRE